MVTRLGATLDDDGRAVVRIEPGEQYARLDLRARHRQLVRDRLQRRAAVHGHRRVAVRRLDLRAHHQQRHRDPIHRPGAERLVPGQHEPPLLTGEDAREQAHECAGIAAIDRGVGFPEALQTDSIDANNVDVRVVHAGSQHPQRARSRLGVLRSAEVADLALALGECSEEQRAVRDRLRARHRDVADERRGRFDAHRPSRRPCPSARTARESRRRSAGSPPPGSAAPRRRERARAPGEPRR